MPCVLTHSEAPHRNPQTHCHLSGGPHFLLPWMLSASSNWLSRVLTLSMSISPVHHCQINLPKPCFQFAIALLRTFQWFSFVCRIKSNASAYPFPVTLCTSLLYLSCILVTVHLHTLCPCSHLTLPLGKSRLYGSISKGAYSHLRRWVSFLWAFLTHAHFYTFTTSDFLLCSGIYWAWVMSISMQYKFSLLFHILSSMGSKSLFYSLCMTYNI